MGINLQEVLNSYDVIDLRKMTDYKLLNRIDTKFICNVEILPEILKINKDQFKVQVFKDEWNFNYESLYFDTPNLKSFYDHHQGKRNRYKIRFRKYLNTGDSFLEVKKKKSFIRTDKRRSEFELVSKMNKKHLNFLNNHISLSNQDIVPSIWTIFDRVTLAGKNHLERVTIDTNIRFKDKSGKVVNMPNMAILEVKREKTGDLSPFIHSLKEMRIRPFGISKYILGNILLSPKIKHNRFHNKVVTVNKICNGIKFSY